MSVDLSADSGSQDGGCDVHYPFSSQTPLAEGPKKKKENRGG